MINKHVETVTPILIFCKRSGVDVLFQHVFDLHDGIVDKWWDRIHYSTYEEALIGIDKEEQDPIYQQLDGLLDNSTEE